MIEKQGIGTERIDPATEGLIALSYSALRDYRNCPKKFDFRYQERIVPKDRDDNLYLGDAFHESLDLWYSGMKEGKPVAETKRAIWEYIQAAFKPRLNNASDGKAKGQFLLIQAMLKAYFNEYPEEPWEVLEVESKFRVPIINPATGHASRTFCLFGKIDGLVRTPDGLMLLEHKTASQVDGQYIERLPMDFQIQLYSQYYSRLLGEPIVGAVYNVIAKSRLSQKIGETEEEYEARKAELAAKNKSGKSSAKRSMPETDEEFLARLGDWYTDETKGAFYRTEIFFDQDRLAVVESEVWELTKSLLEARRAERFFLNTDHCFNFRKPCPYWRLCSTAENPVIKEMEYQPKNQEKSLSPDSLIDSSTESDDDAF